MLACVRACVCVLPVSKTDRSCTELSVKSSTCCEKARAVGSVPLNRGKILDGLPGGKWPQLLNLHPLQLKEGKEQGVEVTTRK